ncbi:DUF2254 domain-containing protein [Psychrobacter aestuarii]|uniref:DUF2254 domain-containing protein n=1 Tax=Psychrobacter aestuarii TaxID=556327 RepID=A0ABN0VVX7_9GAMM|nr:DUF2254 domain-containing protein [Psychrobacter aestuarii]
MTQHKGTNRDSIKESPYRTLHWLRKFVRLWSLQTLTDVPERLHNLWQKMIGSYWFIPTACVLLGILLAPTLIAIDHQFDSESIKNIGIAFTGNDDTARAIVTSIASAVLGVAGTTFSITIAVLSMASSQFGPRLLRNFLTDTPNQFVLGAFIGTFSYSLLILKSIYKSDVASGVPQLAVTFAIVMAIVCALLLVYFVQHMVHAIQASHVIQGASNDAISNIHYWYRAYCDTEHNRHVEDSSDINDYRDWHKIPIYAPISGYIVQLYTESLVTLAKDYGGVIEMHAHLGAFVTDRNVVGHFYQRPEQHGSHVQRSRNRYLAILPRAVDALFWQRFAASLHIERRRTHSNDISYSLSQMTEIAIRALSPGINDPKTAVNCVQSLTMCISIMMRRQPPSPYHFFTPPDDYDQIPLVANQPRPAILAVVARRPTISDFITTSLGEIRHYAMADLMVLKALCQSMVDLNYARVNDAQRQSLLHELGLIERAGQDNLGYTELIADLEAMCKQAREFINDKDAHRKHFAYVSDFDAHIRSQLRRQFSES